MKKKILFIFVLALMASCSSEKENKDMATVDVEIEYPFIMIEQFKEFPVENKSMKQILNSLRDIEASFAGKNKAMDFVYRIYVNEEGKVDYLKALHSDNEELDRSLRKEISSWEMENFSDELLKRKYSFNWAVFYRMKKTGHYSFIPTYLGEKDFIDKDSFYFKSSTPPEPFGGIIELQRRIEYPDRAKDQGLQGRVFVRAFINKKGEVERAIVEKGFDSECDLAAKQAVLNTKFIPSVENGDTLYTTVIIPIQFRLQ